MVKKEKSSKLSYKDAKSGGKKGGKEEETKAPQIKGCHVSIDVCGGCIKPKDPIPEANSTEGVKLACSNHNCPFSNTRSVHKECFAKLTDAIVSMLTRTGSSSWTDEQRRENAWRKKGLTFVGKFITCPCGHGRQTLEDSENRWSRLGEVVLDASAYEKQREEKLKRAQVKHEKPAHHVGPKNFNLAFGGKDHAALEKRLDREQWEKEDRIAAASAAAAEGGSGNPFAASSSKKAKTGAAARPVQQEMDDDGFTTVGKDRRAAQQTTAPTPDRKGKSKASPAPSSSLNRTPSSLFGGASAQKMQTPTSGGRRGTRTISTSSTTSWTGKGAAAAAVVGGSVGRKGGWAAASSTAGSGTKRRDSERENRFGSVSSAGVAKKKSFSYLSGDESEGEEMEEENIAMFRTTTRSLREFVDEFHAFSGIGLWTETQVREINQHLSLYEKDDSATFTCRATGRTLKDPYLLVELTPRTSWMLSTQAMAIKKPDIPPNTQLYLDEYYSIFYNYEFMHPEDPIIFCRDGTQALLECVDMTICTVMDE